MNPNPSPTSQRIYKTDTFPVVLSAVNKLADLLKPTYGKDGRGVLIDTGLESSVLDDGFSIVEELEFEDPYENSVLKFIREATRRTNKRAGDGRTTTILLLRSLLSHFGEIGEYSTLHEENLKKASALAIQALRDKAEPITTVEELKAVARVSFHNDKIAGMIADLVFKVGADGTIAVEESDLLEATSEVKEGFFYEKGYSSPYMVTDADRMVAELKDPHILLIDGILTSFDAVAPVLSHLAGSSQSLLVVGDVEGEALRGLLLNKLNGKLLSVVTKGIPGRKGFYEDLALATGAQVFSTSKGDTLATPGMCGRADKVIVTESNTTIIGVKGNKEEVERKVEALKQTLEEGDEFTKKEVKLRIAQLTNGIGVLRIGALTDGERRFIKAKAEDSVHATQLAYKGGVVEGGGQAFKSVARTGDHVLDQSLLVPYKVLGEKAVAIKDPVEVCVIALESAVSIASTLYRSEGIITTK